MSGSSEANLEWIAAVFRPEAVTSLRGKPDSSYDSRTAVKIADWLLGKHQLRPTLVSPEETSDDIALQGVILSFDAARIRDGVAILTDEIFGCAQSDPAKACALALLASCACGTLEDYEKCESLLGAVLNNVRTDTVRDKFIKAALLHQRAFRRRDAGKAYEDDVVTVAGILDSLNYRRLPDFPVNAVTRSYEDALEHIIAALRWSNWNMVSPLRSDLSDNLKMVIPSWEDQSRSRQSEELLLIDRDIAGVYAKLIEDQYSSPHERRTVFGGKSFDLSLQLIRLELLGASKARQLRRHLAQMRIMQDSDSSMRDYFFADSLRLFRQASAEADLKVAVDSIVKGGPLSALSADARLVLRRPYNELRTPELLVLRASADLLSEPEARDAMDGLMEINTPPSMVGYWQATSVRFEALWRTICALSTAAGKSEVAAEYLLTIVTDNPDADTGIIHAVARSLREIEWDSVPDSVRKDWADWVESASTEWAEVSDALSHLLNLKKDLPRDISTVSDVVRFVNAINQNGPISPDDVAQAADVLKSAMSRIRDSARRHSFSIGSYDAAEIAVLLAINASHDELWQYIANFLTDSYVSRNDKTRAFERLAYLRPNLPESVLNQFQGAAPEILDPSATPFIDSGAIRPYPAALRFFASCDLMAPAKIFADIGRLAGQSGEGASEAAATVSILASRDPSDWILSMALQLSYSPDANVKIAAGRSLALVSNSQPQYEEIASKRLIELLDHDGAMIPTNILGSLDVRVSVEIRDKIAHMRDDHPSRRVRRAADLYLSRR